MKTSVQLKQLVSESFSQEDTFFNRFLPKTTFNPIKRTKLWDLNEMHHCPVIGNCLSVDDLTRFAKRFRFSASTLHNEYLMHVEAVNRSGTRNAFSKAIQKHLDVKYKNHITGFSQAKTDVDVLEIWKKYYIRGEGTGAMWAALTHKVVSDKTRDAIYAGMHMLSHQTGAGQSADVRRLNELENENIEVKTALKQQQRSQAHTVAKLQQKLNMAANELENLRQGRNTLVTLQARIDDLESGAVMVQMGRRLEDLTVANEQLLIVAERGSKVEKALEASLSKVKVLVQERDSLTSERDALKQQLQVNTIEEKLLSNPQPSSDGELPRHFSCVLCVGGRVSSLPQYRIRAKQLGIDLIHHDGGEQESLSRLPDLINQAHAVICPTDYVSHAAYYQIKHQCKRNKKICLLFKGASVSNIGKVLTKLSSYQVYKDENFAKIEAV